MSNLDNETRSRILQFQKNEITEHFIYKTLARFTKNEPNRALLEKISEEELNHYQTWKKYTQKEVKPNRFQIWLYLTLSWLLGLTFAIRLMESGEKTAQTAYSKISPQLPEAQDIYKQEIDHEQALIRLIDEERLFYMGSVVLGLNDALVEFTGALAGFTLALQNSHLIGMVGMIMGISASLSMAGSEYLSTKVEAQGKKPLKASLYTGIAYMLTVLILISPYLIFSNHFFSLALMMFLAVMLIFAFSFYFSVVKETELKKHLLEMLAISLGVAIVSFTIGFAIRKIWNIEI